MHTEEQILAEIKKLPAFDDETLVFYFQVISSKQSAKEKKLYEPLQKAIEKERKRRGTASAISSKIVQPKTPKKSEFGAQHDDY